LLAPDSGKLSVGAHPFFDSDRGVNLNPAKRQVGLVFADLALFPHLRVEENVAYGIAGLARAERVRRVDHAMRSFRIEHLRGRKPRTASSGEAQRVALARSLVAEPRVLLLDEPLRSLDTASKSAIIDDMRAWNASRRIPILYITHDVEEALALGERVVVMERGRILAQGGPLDVLRMPRHETIARLAGFENIFDAAVEACHETDGTMISRLAETQVRLEVPLTRVPESGRVRVAIRAGDIMLAATRPQNLSARNILEGTIARLTPSGSRVELQVDCGVVFAVHLTPGAVRSLGLQEGRPVWLIIKSHSCHLVA
jgi:molybdate transport system ATP-binding protein